MQFVARPRQRPPRQASSRVQSRPSSQRVPSALGGALQGPVAGSHGPSSWHGSSAWQVTVVSGVHAPARQASPEVHSEWSSQAVPSPIDSRDRVALQREATRRCSAPKASRQRPACMSPDAGTAETCSRPSHRGCLLHAAMISRVRTLSGHSEPILNKDLGPTDQNERVRLPCCRSAHPLYTIRRLQNLA